jgi:hypothetical protein
MTAPPKPLIIPPLAGTVSSCAPVQPEGSDMPDRNRTRTAKAREQHIQGPAGRGCAICGGCTPVLANLGLHESHIVSGVHKIENKLFLCARCAEAFDRVLKPLIWNALRLYAGGKAPDNWATGEGRLCTKDLDAFRIPHEFRAGAGQGTADASSPPAEPQDDLESEPEKGAS